MTLIFVSHLVMTESIQYSISDLSHYTGIKAHTIRTWEKRFNLFCPKRSCTNIRTYDDQELRKLINIQSLIQAGWKISKIVELDDEQLELKVKEFMLAYDQESYPDFLINSLVVHMLGFDELKFSQVLHQVLDQYGVKRTILKVIYPFLKRVGLLWQVNDISPAQEHFASAIIRRKLLMSIDQIDLDFISHATCILCLPPDEFHELPLLLAHYILLENKIKTIYLGSSVPADVAAQAAIKCNASYLFTVFMSNSPMEKLKDYLININEKAPNLQIQFSGCPEICKKPIVNDKISYLSNIEEFELMANSISK